VAIPEQDDPLSLPVVFVGADDTPILYANQFVVQVEGNDIIVTAGQLAPPILLGNADEQREQARQISYVPIRVIARLAINRERAAQLVALLGNQLRRDDEGEEQRG
jgi:hypothetical protein